LSEKLARILLHQWQIPTPNRHQRRREVTEVKSASGTCTRSGLVCGLLAARLQQESVQTTVQTTTDRRYSMRPTDDGFGNHDVILREESP